MQNFILSIFTLLNLANGKVYELTDQDYNQIILDSPFNWMIMFYMPDEKDSMNLYRQWEEASGFLIHKVNFGKVDLSVNHELRERYKVKTFPYIRVYHDRFDYGDGKLDQNVFYLPYRG